MRWCSWMNEAYGAVFLRRDESHRVMKHRASRSQVFAQGEIALRAATIITAILWRRTTGLPCLSAICRICMRERVRTRYLTRPAIGTYNFRRNRRVISPICISNESPGTPARSRTHVLTARSYQMGFRRKRTSEI